MHLTLVISSLSCGGAERVMSIMANYWVVKKWEITLLTFDDGSRPPFYDLDTRVRHISLCIASDSPNPIVSIWNNLKRIQILRAAIAQSKPDVVISFIDQVNVLTLLATRALNVPVIVSERVDPALYSIGRIWEQLRRWTYPLADRIVVQTQGALSYFSSELQTRACTIPNPVLPPNDREQIAHSLADERFSFKGSTHLLIAMGRLTKQKGFDMLLQSFARLKDIHSEWTLIILGEGELRTELESLRERLGLSDQVHLPGVVNNPHKVLMKADIFVMSSRFEGFPNALCEAMACGLPVISTDCPSGPREIIRDGVDGILVPDKNAEALTVAMDRLMSDEAERKHLSINAKQVVKRFSLEKVMRMWEDLLSDVHQKTPENFN